MKGLREKCKEIYYDNIGSTVIEAAIYYPIIIIAVLVVVMLSLFKLDKIMTQTNLSIKTKDAQMDISKEDVYKFQYIQTMGNNSVFDDKRILDATNSNSRVYQWGLSGIEYIYPIAEVDYTSQYSLDFMGLVPETTSHGSTVIYNPQNISLTMHAVSMYQDVTSKKIGYSYGDYLKVQYGN